MLKRIFGQNATMCTDIGAVHKDVELQREANHVLVSQGRKPGWNP